MPTLNIKDPKIYECVQQLSNLRGTTMTNAVRSAIEEALERELQQKDERMQAIEDFLNSIHIDDTVLLNDDDIFDEDGLPY